MRLTLGSTQMGEGEGGRLEFENTDRAYDTTLAPVDYPGLYLFLIDI